MLAGQFLGQTAKPLVVKQKQKPKYIVAFDRGYMEHVVSSKKKTMTLYLMVIASVKRLKIAPF